MSRKKRIAPKRSKFRRSPRCRILDFDAGLCVMNSSLSTCANWISRSPGGARIDPGTAVFPGDSPNSAARRVPSPRNSIARRAPSFSRSSRPPAPSVLSTEGCTEVCRFARSSRPPASRRGISRTRPAKKSRGLQVPRPAAMSAAAPSLSLSIGGVQPASAKFDGRPHTADGIRSRATRSDRALAGESFDVGTPVARRTPRLEIDPDSSDHD